MDEPSQFQLRGSYRKSAHGAIKNRTERVTILIDEGRDVTPKPLNPEVYGPTKEKQINIFEAGGLERADISGSVSVNIFTSQSTARFRTDVDRQLDQSLQYKGSVSYESNLMDALILDLSSSYRSSSSSSDRFSDSSEANSGEFEARETMKDVPTHINLILSETNTVILLDIPSSTAIRDSDEGIIVDEQNKIYEYLTVGKGRNRKMVTAEVQTVPILKKSRNTEAERVKTHNDFAYVSNYEMYDTYQALAEVMSDESDGSEDNYIKKHKANISSVDGNEISQEEKQLQKLMKNQRFLEAVCVIQRLLANNCYNEQQKWFRGLSIPSDFRDNIEYNYKMTHLWTFANEYTKGKCVNAFHWNPSNRDILAVGYGKFYFTDNIPGLVLIWNIKNPVEPERKYDFCQSVTALNFSKKTPNLLAVGFYNGYVIVLNIVSREKMIVGENTPPFEPVLNLVWQEGQNEFKNMEVVIGTFSDGRIYLYVLERKLKEQQIMRVTRVEGTLKGYDAIADCTNVTMPVSRYAGACIFTPHPVNNDLYFIGTNQGVVHKCSKNYLNQHLESFLAHNGPIRGMKFSPFAPKIYGTCGDDWNSRLWAEDIAEPLMEFGAIQQSVLGNAWSPSHSTISATVRGANILLWDFQRKGSDPQSVITSATNSRNTFIEFTDSGRCLVVGDIDGNIHVFALEDMPFQAFFQENALYESLYRALVTEPELLRKLKKVRKSSQIERLEDT